MLLRRTSQFSTHHASPLSKSITPSVSSASDDASSIFDFTDEFVDAYDEEDEVLKRRDSASSTSTGKSQSQSEDSGSDSDDSDRGEDESDLARLTRGAAALLDQLEAVMGGGTHGRPISSTSSIVTIIPTVSRNSLSPAPTPSGSTQSAIFPVATLQTATLPACTNNTDFSFTSTDISDIDVEDLLRAFDQLEADLAVGRSQAKMAASLQERKLSSPTGLRRGTSIKHSNPLSDLPYAELFPTAAPATAFPTRKASTPSLRQPFGPKAVQLPPHPAFFTNPFPSPSRSTGALPFPSTSASPFGHQQRASVTSTSSSASRSSYQSSAGDSFRWSVSSSTSSVPTVADESLPSSRRVSSASSCRSSSGTLLSPGGSRHSRRTDSDELDYEDFLHELASEEIADIPEEPEVVEEKQPLPLSRKTPSVKSSSSKKPSVDYDHPLPRRPSAASIKSIQTLASFMPIPPLPTRSTSLVSPPTSL